MNPMMIFFILTIFVNDILFNYSRLTKIYFVFVIIYWVIYALVGKSNYHDPNRKWLLASYSQSYDPSVYAKIKLDVKKVREFIEEQFNKTGKKISYVLYFTKILAEAFKEIPETNIAINFGKIVERGTVDIGVLVDIDGKVIYITYYLGSLFCHTEEYG
jgi:hypothetical protein